MGALCKLGTPRREPRESQISESSCPSVRPSVRLALHDITKLENYIHIKQVPAQYPLSIAGIFKVDTCLKKFQFCGVAQMAADF
jgi:hypothetical protein